MRQLNAVRGDDTAPGKRRPSAPKKALQNDMRLDDSLGLIIAGGRMSCMMSLLSIGFTELSIDFNGVRVCSSDLTGAPLLFKHHFSHHCQRQSVSCGLCCGKPIGRRDGACNPMGNNARISLSS
ncbi:hypothetical protein KD146_14145 [Devosia sp. BSSL-BM10]|uniref:Uncharacterized protein n=1 Tax=Devosia litorisediminis TaxID=2829817 RepID=A0A942ECE0_9HYPH|nr:hypothetical protein [Devosia litorisediminis]MBS3849839.1 hypothetical protein [Devosia litorisediminis]